MQKPNEMFVSSLLFACLYLLTANASPLPQNQRVKRLNNELAIHLLQSAGNEDNAFFSPLGLSTALLALLKGSKGETETELKQALDITSDDDIKELEEGVGKILKTFSKDENLRLLTRIIINNENAKQEFVNTLKEKLETQVLNADFSKDSKKTTQELNEWINNETKGKITRLFKDSLPTDSGTVLASIASFSPQWKREFKDTEKREFHNFVSYDMPGLKTKIPFMVLEDSLKAKQSPELKSQLISIPFASDLSLVVLMPEKTEDLQYLNENTTLTQIESAIDDLEKTTPEETRLFFPKLKLETEYDLKETLEDLDVRSISISGALEKASRLSTGIHRAVLDLGINGKEKAKEAKTGSRDIVINKPFVFLIKDSNGVFILSGRVQTLVDEELLGLGFI